jgi:hypothetical protein
VANDDTVVSVVGSPAPVVGIAGVKLLAVDISTGRMTIPWILGRLGSNKSLKSHF